MEPSWLTALMGLWGGAADAETTLRQSRGRSAAIRNVETMPGITYPFRVFLQPTWRMAADYIGNLCLKSRILIQP